MSTDRMRSIVAAIPNGTGRLALVWSDGTKAELAVSGASAASIGEWGHSLVWPGGHEIGADTLWRQTLTALGRDDARQFLEWRLANGLSLAKAAEALGLSRRTVAYYSNGDRPVPKAILLACKGFDALLAKRKAV
ncbi:MAG: helix-turn-helix domain-containing protein [Burkholderiales bacterium]